MVYIFTPSLIGYDKIDVNVLNDCSVLAPIQALFGQRRCTGPTYFKQMLPYNDVLTLVGIKLKWLTNSILKKTVLVSGICDEKKMKDEICFYGNGCTILMWTCLCCFNAGWQSNLTYSTALLVADSCTAGCTDKEQIKLCDDSKG